MGMLVYVCFWAIWYISTGGRGCLEELTHAGDLENAGKERAGRGMSDYLKSQAISYQERLI